MGFFGGGGGGGGSGDVSGPGTSTDTNLASWNGTGGDTLSDSGIATAAVATLTGSQTLTNKTISIASNTFSGLTAGSICYHNGTNITQDNSNLFYDATNKRIGIGVGAPGKSIDMIKTGRCRVEAGVGSGWWYNATGTDTWFVGTDGSANQYFRFYMGNDALKLGPTNTLNPMHQFFQELALTSGTQVFLNIAPTVNQSSSAGYTALKVTATELATGSGNKILLDLTAAGTSRYIVERGRHRFAYLAVSADTTLSDIHYTVNVDASGGAKTITLPAASGVTGAIYNIKKSDSSANAVIIDGNSSETIDGATTQSLTVQYQCLTVQSDGTNWAII